MIKVKKGKLLILGLSDENLKRLKQGQPIKFDMKDLELPGYEMFIFNKPTEEDMLNLLLDIQNETNKI